MEGRVKLERHLTTPSHLPDVQRGEGELEEASSVFLPSSGLSDEGSEQTQLKEKGFFPLKSSH